MAFPSPTLTVPSLSVFQFSYNGYTFGAGTAHGSLTIRGIGALPVRSNDPNRPRDQGALIGLDVLGGRTIDLAEWSKTDGTSLQSALMALASATQVAGSTEQPLWFQLPNLPTMAVMVRPRKRDYTIDVDYSAANITKPAMRFFASDPRIYGVPSQTVTIDLPTPIGGMTFPATFPMAFGGSSGGGGQATVTNNGNFEMRPILVLTGPLTNPWVEQSTIPGSPTLTISNPTQTSYTILSGDQLVIDLDLRSVLYYSGGVASGTAGADRQDWIVHGSTWWNLPPESNLIHFGSDDSSQTGGTCQIQWADGYLL